MVLTKLGFPQLAVDMAVKESAGNLEDSLQILLQVRPNTRSGLHAFLHVLC